MSRCRRMHSRNACPLPSLSYHRHHSNSGLISFLGNFRTFYFASLPLMRFLSVNKIRLLCLPCLGSWCDGPSQYSRLLFLDPPAKSYHSLTRWYALYSPMSWLCSQNSVHLEWRCELALSRYYPNLAWISTNFTNPSPPVQTRCLPSLCSNILF